MFLMSISFNSCQGLSCFGLLCFWFGVLLGFFIVLRISSLTGSGKARLAGLLLLLASDWKLSLLAGCLFFFIVPHIVGKIRKLENRGSRGNVDLETPAIEKTIHSFL